MITPTPARRLVLFAGLLTAVLMSCGRELTGPRTAPVNAFKRFASVAFSPQYETAVRGGALRAALTQVAFQRVRITLRREDGTIALDTVVDFPPGADSLTLALSVVLPADAPASGVPLTLNLGYVNAAGDTVFKGGPITVMAMPSTGGGTPPPPVQVPVHYTGTGANATAVVISPKTVNGTAGQTASFSAQALASNGQVITGTPVVFTSSDEGVVRLDATTGIANLTGRGTARVYAQLLTGPRDSATVSVVLPASRIELVSGGAQIAPAGTALAQPVVARVLAADGVGAAGVTVSFAVTSGGGSVTPASAVSAADGSVSASWKLGSVVGAQALSVSATGLAGSPLAVSATALATTPTKLSLVAQPANGVAGSPLAPVTVAAQTADGVTVATFAGDVTVVLGANPGGATLSGTTTVTAVNGIATFTGLSLNRPGSGYTLVFSSTTLSSATSSPFGIVAGSAARLVFGAMPGAVDVGIAIAPPIQVTAQDSAGNTVTSFTGAVTMAIGNNPGASTLSGTLTRTAVAGVAAFNDLSLNKKGASYTLIASASGMAGSTSTAFNAAAGAPTGISVVSGGGQTAAAGTTLSPIVLKLRDALDNGISGVTISLAVATGGGSLGAASAVTDADGLVTVSWTLGGTGGAQSITAATTGVPTATITATATGGTASKLAVTTPPNSTQTAGVALAPSIVVQAQNSTNVLQTAFTGAVTATVASGPSGATIGGTATVTAVGGVATFSALRLTKVGAYTLQFASSGLASATTASFTVNAAPAQTIAADSGSAQSGAAGAPLAQKLVVLVTDSLGNPVNGKSVSWAVATGGGSVDSATTVTNSTGRTRVTFTLGLTAGSNSVTAASTGLAGSPVTFTATVTAGAIASTLVSPHIDTLTSISATFALTAQAKDGAGSPLTGHFTWLSRNSSYVAVDTNGVVKAITNGSTYVVATETGGTKDSALIVVQQRLATINVTPGTRNIYKTRNYAFAASAVDGMGNVMSGITSFTWSTVTPSVASVDTAGKVTAVSLGSTQVRATAGAITGVATVTVLTPITRIIVGRDSAGVAVTDTTSLTALGTGRYYRAQARDTLDAPMTGVTFTWGSTNGAVAVVDTSLATSAHATANANGVTSVQAAADGVTGTAALKVQQVLASIALTPTNDSVGTGGKKPMVATGKDANNQTIVGGSFKFASSAPTIAMIDSVTGLVTGVALGTTNITATSGSVTSNSAVIKVTSTMPGFIYFGNRSMAVGRGTSTSISILLSRPNASNVTVNLAARDTNAYFPVASVTIPAGQNSANVTLNGRNAGSTVVYATDGSGTGFAGDTATVAVTANMHLASSYWSLNSGDQVSSQVILSDPSPVGGTYVTFTYGTVGVAHVSPDPAFIPAGQLSANIVVSGSSPTNANTTIIPVATGVNGAASTMYVYAPELAITYGSYVLGAGQYDQLNVNTPAYTVSALPLTFTSTDTSVATATSLTGTVTAGSYYSTFTVNGKRAGSASIIVSSPGWKSDTMPVTVTTPKVWISASYTSLTTTSPVQSLYVYTADSTNSYYYYYSTHPRTSSLALTISSSDSSVVKIIDKNPVVAAGSYYVSGVRYQPGGTGGTAWIKVTAGGHTSDSVLVTVAGPKLEFTWSSTYSIGKGQYYSSLGIYAPNAVASALTVTLANSNSAKVNLPSTVTITQGGTTAYFTVAGLDTGLVTFIATAPGYSGDTVQFRVTTPRLYTSYYGTTFNNFGPGSSYMVQVMDSISGSSYPRSTPLPVTLVSRNPAVVAIDSSTVTIATGTYYSNTAHVSPVGIGSTYIVATAAGHAADSALYTVQAPKLNFSFYSLVMGKRQYALPTSYYVYTPDYRSVSVPVTITQRNAAADSLSATALTIPANNYIAYFGMAGRTTGADTIIATASGYLPDTAFVYVSSPGLYQGGIPSSATTTSPASNVYIAAIDSVNYYYSTHLVLDTVVLSVTSSDTTVLKPTSKYVRIPKGSYYVYAGFSYVGPGSAHLTIADSAGTGYPTITTNTTTVTGPSLNFGSSSAMLGVRQSAGTAAYYIYAPNNVTSPLTITLLSTDSSVAVPSPSTITMTTGSSYAYFTIIAKDSIGTIQIRASASGYNPPTPMTVQVTQPKLVLYYTTSIRTTQLPSTVYAYLADANGTTHYNTEAVTVNFTSSNAGVASIDSGSVTIPINAQYTTAPRLRGLSAGTSTLTISDPRATTYHTYNYTSASGVVTVVNPALSFYLAPNTIGLGQYFDPTSSQAYVQVQDNVTSPTAVTLGHTGVAKTSVPATTTIATNTYYSSFKLTGTAIGTDTLNATLTSPLHTPATAYVVVDSGRVDNPAYWPSASMRVGDSVLVTLQTRDPNASYRRKVAAATTFTLAPGSNVEVHVGGVVVTSITVPADANQVQFYLKAKATGTGSVTFTHPYYKTYTPPTVTVIP